MPVSLPGTRYPLLVVAVQIDSHFPLVSDRNSASISGSGSTSRVVLSGTYHRKQFGGIVKSGEHEVRNSDDPIERALWTRLQQLRLAIRER